MFIQLTPSDWLLSSGLAVTALSFWLMFHRRASQRQSPADSEPEVL